MDKLSRRAFLAAATSAVLPARTLRKIGVQLYTVRNVIEAKPLEVLQSLEQIGFREVEVVHATIDKIWPSLKQTGLKPVSLHLQTAMFFADQAKLPAALDDAKAKGFRYVVAPYVDPKNRGGADAMKRLAEVLNSAGERCKSLGLRLAYHNHAFEFEPSANGTLLDVLMTSTDPKLVALEMDVMWVQVAGVDPIKLLSQYKGRVPLMHLKDVAKDSPQRFNESVPKDAFKEAGKGSVDFPAVLKAAAAAGVQHYFVEQDQTPGDPLDSLRESYAYLSKLKS